MVWVAFLRGLRRGLSGAFEGGCGRAGGHLEHSVCLTLCWCAFEPVSLAVFWGGLHLMCFWLKIFIAEFGTLVGGGVVVLCVL